MEELLYRLIKGLLVFAGSVFALFVVYIFLSIPFENISYNWKFSGGYHPPAFSKSIEESKKRNVFIGFLEMDIEYVDSLKNDVELSAEKIWIEQAWNYSAWHYKTHISDSNRYSLYFENPSLLNLYLGDIDREKFHRMRVIYQDSSYDHYTYWTKRSRIHGKIKTNSIDSSELFVIFITSPVSSCNV